MNALNKIEHCFFHPKSIATNDAEYIGYYINLTSTSSYRGIIGLSLANFGLTEDQVYMPRGKRALFIHIFSTIIKLGIFSYIMFNYTQIDLYWRSIIGFIVSMIGSHILHFAFSVNPRNLYLYNLSSLADLAIILFLPAVGQLFFPDLAHYAFIISAIMLFFVNAFTMKLKKYSLYPYPKGLYSMYEVGFRHGSHPQFDNYMGFITKPLRWLY